MRAPSRFHELLKRLLGWSNSQHKAGASVDASREPACQTEATPLFSLGEDKQELVASYRNFESKSA